jgi:hypothetical protein
VERQFLEAPRQGRFQIHRPAPGEIALEDPRLFRGKGTIENVEMT